jgi:CRP-like cAMP-binding protein
VHSRPSRLQASWCGIVCQGSLEAVVDEHIVAYMEPGHIVGELAFFGGEPTIDGKGTSTNRAADVRGCSFGYIGMIEVSCHSW